MIVLDTNVVSELIKSNPDPNVLAWFAAQDAAELWTTATALGELSYGIAKLPWDSRRQTALRQSLAHFLSAGLSDHVLPYDGSAALAYGELSAWRERNGRRLEIADGQIAATALANQARLLATRDTGHFDPCGIPVLNPFQPASSPKP